MPTRRIARSLASLRRYGPDGCRQVADLAEQLRDEQTRPQSSYERTEKGRAAYLFDRAEAEVWGAFARLARLREHDGNRHREDTCDGCWACIELETDAFDGADDDDGATLLLCGACIKVAGRCKSCRTPLTRRHLVAERDLFDGSREYLASACSSACADALELGARVTWLGRIPSNVRRRVAVRPELGEGLDHQGSDALHVPKMSPAKGEGNAQ